MQAVLDYARAHAQRFEAELDALLRIPSVSTDPAFAPEVRRAADWLAEKLRTIGLSAEVIPTQRHPLVYAEWLGAGADKPTVLIYGHYDVQPAVVSDGWDSDPFVPVVRDGVVYARGATDDKGQMYAHVLAVESWLQGAGHLPVNVKFIIEGEEESGGENIARYVREQGERLRADVCLLSDTSMGDIAHPVITYSLRGICGFELVVQGPQSDLHSGMFGGTVHNPLHALASVISSFHNPDGSVAIAGFYEDVELIADEERAAIAKLPWGEADWYAETGAPQPWGEAGYSLLERIGKRPTVEVNGMAGGYFGEGGKSIIPSKAWAKITTRLVANQQPDRIAELLRAHIARVMPPTVRWELTAKAGYPAARVPLESAAMAAAIRAYEQGWGAAPLFKPEGGSIPIVADIQAHLHMPVVMMGFGLNSDGLHGPNEHFSLAMFHKGIATSVHFLHEMTQEG